MNTPRIIIVGDTAGMTKAEIMELLQDTSAVSFEAGFMHAIDEMDDVEEISLDQIYGQGYDEGYVKGWNDYAASLTKKIIPEPQHIKTSDKIEATDKDKKAVEDELNRVIKESMERLVRGAGNGLKPPYPVTCTAPGFVITKENSLEDILNSSIKLCCEPKRPNPVEDLINFLIDTKNID